MLCYGSSNLGSWKDVYDMTPSMRKYYVDRLQYQWEEEKRNHQT